MEKLDENLIGPGFLIYATCRNQRMKLLEIPFEHLNLNALS